MVLQIIMNARVSAKICLPQTNATRSERHFFVPKILPEISEYISLIFFCENMYKCCGTHTNHSVDYRTKVKFSFTTAPLTQPTIIIRH